MNAFEKAFETEMKIVGKCETCKIPLCNATTSIVHNGKRYCDDCGEPIWRYVESIN